ncbi:MAG TPA: HigA family addiction module antitoxin, partial [Thermomicrobiales bacterium]|nr:HigA family addiction module antitoxin [Thermomicrobiales bacterium]
MTAHRPIHAIHPGEYLLEEIEARDMTAANLSRALGVPQNRISEILRGRRAITVDTALRLARWIGSSPQYWLNLQQTYDLRVAEQALWPEIERTVTPDSSPIHAAWPAFVTGPATNSNREGAGAEVG